MMRRAWIRIGQEVVNGNSASLQIQTEPVEVLLPNSMHTGQIIMLTRMITASDLRFHDFDPGLSLALQPWAEISERLRRNLLNFQN